MRIERGSRASSLVWLVAGLAASLSARGEDFYRGLQTPHTDWALFADVGHTDNATLLPNGPSDTIVTAGLDTSLYRDTGRLKADVAASAYWEDYLNGTFKDHVLGHLVGLVSYAFVPERFIWVVEDTYGQLNANPLLPTTPENRLNANVVTTGPDLYLHLSGDTELQLGARYSQSNFQQVGNANPDDQRLMGHLGLVQHLSQSTALSLNGAASQIQSQFTGQPTYDEYEAYGRYAHEDTRSGLALDAGASEIRQAHSVEHAPLLRLTLYRRLTPYWNVNLSAGSLFENSAYAFQSALGGTQVVNGQVVPTAPGATGPGTAGAGTADVIVSHSAFRAETARIGVEFVTPRTRFDINGGIERDRFQFGASDLDRDVISGGGSFSRYLRRAVAVRLAATYERRAPLATLPADRTLYGDLAVDWRFGPLLQATLAYHHEARSTELGGFAYTENLIYLRLSYGPPKRSNSGHGPSSGAPGTQTTGP